MNIVVVGSSNTDMIIKVPNLPNPGETILGGEFTQAAGGKGANQAVAAARAGGNVSFIARVGQDMFGKSAIEGLKSDGINVDNVIIDESAPSGVAQIFVSEDGENCIGVASGANANLSKEDILNMQKKIAFSDILLTQLETPIDTIEEAMKIANENGATVILNPAPAQKLSDKLLSYVSILTPNETEAEILTGIPVNDELDAEKAAKLLLKKGIKLVIITLGSKGVLVANKEMVKLYKAYKVTAIDTTAAGDVFNGALAVAFSQNKEIEDAIQFSQKAAAISVTRLGAQPSAPSLLEINDFNENIPMEKK